MKAHPIHTALPVEAQLELMRASLTPITRDDPLARIKAIEKATQRVKHNHPQFFKRVN
jgi:hypothetical protein